MSKDGRIGNRGLLKGLADFLQMEGVHRMPNQLNLDQVQVTSELGNAGFSNRQIERGSVTNFPLAGLATFSQAIAGFQTGTFQSLITSNNNQGPLFDARMLSLWFAIEFDAAGALAFNGKDIDVSIQYMDFTGATRVGIVQDLFPFVTVATADLTYVWAMGGSHNDQARRNDNGIPQTLWIPSELAFAIDIESHDGTVFPANTVLQVLAVAAKQPAGRQIPF